LPDLKCRAPYIFLFSFFISFPSHICLFFFSSHFLICYFPIRSLLFLFSLGIGSFSSTFDSLSNFHLSFFSFGLLSFVDCPFVRLCTSVVFLFHSGEAYVLNSDPFFFPPLSLFPPVRLVPLPMWMKNFLSFARVFLCPRSLVRSFLFFFSPVSHARRLYLSSC